MIVLNNNDIARATQGRWINRESEIPIERVVFRLAAIEPGDIFFPYETDDWIESSDNNNRYVEKAFKRGAVAVALPEKTDIKTPHPTLLVEDLRAALRNFSTESSKKTEATKVMVTGSFGKTGFKHQLHTLIGSDLNTLAFPGSANQSLPIYKSMASIQEDNEVVIVEVAAPGYRVAKRRSRYVTPDIAVVTNIGPEHLKQHGGSIENVITNKARTAYGLNDGGLMIIPDQKEYDTKTKMKKVIHKINPTINILTFGEDHDNDAYIIDKEFTNEGWKLRVSINSREVSFAVPFLEEYSVKAVLPILLVCDRLNLDLDKVVSRYPSYRHFESSGNYYEVQYKDKTFFLYDQSIRGILAGYKETLKIIANMQPVGKGRKLAVFSEFVDLNESAVDLVDTQEFKGLFEKSNLDALFTINLFSEHINVLHDKSIWLEHRKDIEDITPRILNEIQDKDMLFIRATLKCKANRLVRKILEGAVHVKQFY